MHLLELNEMEKRVLRKIPMASKLVSDKVACASLIFLSEILDGKEEVITLFRPMVDGVGCDLVDIFYELFKGKECDENSDEFLSLKKALELVKKNMPKNANIEKTVRRIALIVFSRLSLGDKREAKKSLLENFWILCDEKEYDVLDDLAEKFLRNVEEV